MLGPRAVTSGPKSKLATSPERDAPTGGARMASLLSFLIPSRFTIWAVSSTALAVAVVQHAAATRENFFSAAVFLSTSKFSLAALANFCVVLLVGFGRADSAA